MSCFIMLLNAQIEICFNLIPHKWANYDNNNNNNMCLEFKIQRKNIQVLWTIYVKRNSHNNT